MDPRPLRSEASLCGDDKRAEMKYDSQLTELKSLLPTAKNILIVLPANASIDILSAGLALFLTLEASGKQVSIVCQDSIKVGQSYLFGVDQIESNTPSTDGGNLTLTLEGVAASDNTIPALEKLDWFAENSNLNLVFHVSAGQTFQPSRIVPRYQGSGFNLIFVVGAVNLNALGNVYNSNPQAFSGTHIVNIDTQVANTSFGQTNILDTGVSSLSEVMSVLITDLGFNLSSDSASNLLAGIFASTNNLTDDKTNAETYMSVANCLRVGGRKPASINNTVQSGTQPYNWSALMQNPPTPPYAAPLDNSGDDSMPANALPSVQQVDQPSPEERPYEEGVISENIEPEWLTPKIFKGSSIG